MEPHREEPQRASDAMVEQKPKRFRIVKLEERIAPSQGKGNTNKSCNCFSNDCSNTCWSYPACW
jgi:hypothetical protein